MASFPPALCLHQLNLSRFRNYEALRLSPAGARVVVLTGPNGAGKTNVLEAVSLLTPGRGLRGADLGEMQRHTPVSHTGASRYPDESAHGPRLTPGWEESVHEKIGIEPWAVAAEVETAQGVILRVGTGLKDDGRHRVVRLNGKDLKNQSELSSIVSCVWLTPQMDRLFIEGASGRRRFLDRLVYAHAPDHAFHVARAEKNTRERLRLLLNERDTRSPADPVWLNSLEAQMAADFVAIAAARRDLLRALGAHLERLEGMQALFPLPALGIAGAVEKSLETQPALAVEDQLRAALTAGRGADAAAGRSLTGTQLSDFTILYAAKDAPAAQCSTGEQKGLLVSIVLAHALMMKADKGRAPLLLLDEVAAHLDENRRGQLFDILAEAGGQVWLTGTDSAVFFPLKNSARFFRVEEGRVREER